MQNLHLAGNTINKMAFLGGEEGAALCIALLCTIVLRRRLSSKKRSTWARKWLQRQQWDPDNVISTEKTTGNNQFDPLFKIILDVIHRSNHCLQRVLFEVDFLHNIYCVCLIMFVLNN
jgi:hypothetical protein